MRDALTTRGCWHDGRMPNATETDFDGISLEVLRERQSAKWRVYPEDVLPAWVAEMDIPLAAPIRQALLAAVERSDTGYAHADPRLARASPAAPAATSSTWMRPNAPWPRAPAPGCCATRTTPPAWCCGAASWKPWWSWLPATERWWSPTRSTAR